MMTAGYFRLLPDLPKPFWRYPISYINYGAWAIQVIFPKKITSFNVYNCSKSIVYNYGCSGLAWYEACRTYAAYLVHDFKNIFPYGCILK